MRKVKLDTVRLETLGWKMARAKDPSTPEPEMYSFATGIMQAVDAKFDRNGQRSGLTPSDNRLALKIATAVDKATDAKATHVILDDAEWAYLNERVQTFPYAFACEAFEQFIEAVEKAETFDPNAPMPSDGGGSPMPAQP